MGRARLVLLGGWPRRFSAIDAATRDDAFGKLVGAAQPHEGAAKASESADLLLLLRNTDDLAATIAVIARPHRKIVGATRRRPAGPA